MHYMIDLVSVFIGVDWGGGGAGFQPPALQLPVLKGLILERQWVRSINKLNAWTFKVYIQNISQTFILLIFMH